MTTVLDLPQHVHSKIDRGDPDECWPWNAALQSMGYPMVNYRNKVQLATRLIYKTVNGPLGDKEMVLHWCDEPACCNPRHLFKGTQLDNMRDCNKKKRHAHGETSYAKLTEKDVLEIRADSRTQQEVADEYGVCRQTISDIKRRKSWTHLTDETV